MRFVHLLAYLAITGLGLSAFQNCSPAKFADSNAEVIQSSLSASTITINNDATYTNNRTVRVQISMDNPLQMFVTNNPDCSTGGQWQPYSAEIPWVLGETNQDTKVYVKFKSEYTESSCTSDSIIHDDILPNISLAQAVANITNTSSVSIKLNASDVGSGLDKIACPSDVSNCGTMLTIANTTEGQRINTFYAYDKAGNRSLPLSVSWLYDKTGPNINFSITPANKTKDFTSNFKVVGNDNYAAANKITYKRSVDGAAYIDSLDTFAVTVTQEGAHNVKVIGYDEAGNASSEITYNWTVGTQIPSIRFTEKPKDYDNTLGKFSFAGEDQFNQPLTKFECSLNGSAFASCVSPYIPTSLPQGVNNFKVRGIDSLNLVSGELPYSWKYDTQAPTLTFKTFPKPFTKNTSESASVNVTETYGISSIAFYLDGVLKSAPTSMLDSALFDNLSEVQHTVKVVATDMAGNVSVSLEKSFWSDFHAPIINPISISSPTKNTTLSASVNITDNNTDPANTLSNFYYLDAAVLETAFASSPLIINNLTNGLHKIKVYATDQAGNKSEFAYSNDFYVDLVAPVITFNKKPADNMATGSKSIINFMVTDAGAGVLSYTCAFAVGSAPPSALSCSENIDLAFLNSNVGAYQFSVTATDKVGWSTTSKVNWVAANQYLNKTTLFNVSAQVNNKVDILFVIDNSKSMADEQQKLADAFSSFLNNIQGLDWRIAITTTDVSGSNAGSRGQIYKLGSAGNSPYFIDSSNPDAANILKTYIVTGVNQDDSASKERGLSAVHLFVDRVINSANSNEKSFYRPEAVLSTIIVTDSDEAQYESNYKTSEAFLNGDASGIVLGIYDKLPNKTYINHSSIVLPNDSTCLANGEDEGITYYNVSKDTDGINASICSTNYGSQMTNFASSILTKITEISLDCAPVDSNNDNSIDISISYKATPSSTPVTLAPSSYSLLNTKVKFNSPPNNTGDYTVNYVCLSSGF